MDTNSIIFPPEVLSKLFRPVVYIFRQEQTVLYVGMSSTGITRPFNPQHHKIDATLANTSMEIRFCATIEEAALLEVQLIQELKPTLNAKTKPHKFTARFYQPKLVKTWPLPDFLLAHASSGLTTES